VPPGLHYVVAAAVFAEEAFESVFKW